MPELILLFTDHVPDYIGDTTLGQFVWGTIFTVYKYPFTFISSEHYFLYQFQDQLML